MPRSTLLFLLVTFLCCCSNQESIDKTQKNVIKIAVAEDPQTIDPRMARTLNDSTVVRMLYEGLMRIDSKGNPQNALAEEIIVSPDQKHYEVHLRESLWSDGSPVTSEDFVDTWKSMLDPQFPSPIASKLFAIKGAKEAKGGLIPLHAVGLKVMSPSVFEIELTEPIAYFNEFMTLPPVHKKIRSSALSADSSFHVYNGPFKLTEWSHHHRVMFAKNNLYWDKDAVSLEGVEFVVAEESTALNLYRKKELDWVGSPLSVLPQDLISNLRKDGVLQVAPASGTYWFRFNTERTPFHNNAVRKAFNLALNRSDLVAHVTQGDQQPALSILPPSLELHSEGYYADNQPAQAKLLFLKAVEESGLTESDLSSIVLSYTNNERNHKIAQAVQQQWMQVLGVPITLQAYEGKVSLDALSRGKYQIMLGSWFADINDPINFLEVFKSKNNGINNTGWENAIYSNLLDKSNSENDPKKRRLLMARAEDILMEALPIAPLFYNAYNYIKNEKLQGVYFSELGYLDFKHAQIVNNDKNKGQSE